MQQSSSKKEKADSRKTKKQLQSEKLIADSCKLTTINYIFFNKSKLLQKFSTSLQNRRHFSVKNNTI